MPLDSASIRISVLVMTQSTSRTPRPGELEPAQTSSVSSSRLASSFLSKQGMTARCQILLGAMPKIRLRVVFNIVPIKACGDLTLERWGRTYGCVFSA